MSDNATITASSPIKIAETAVSADASSIRADAEKAASAVRADVSQLATAIKTDVAKADSIWPRIKPYALGFLAGWPLGFIAGHFAARL